jgi:beta-lactamase superfamily II metal-dependent hydrolase
VTRVHLLDVGRREYGDAVLCELAGKRILIDGAHKGDQELIARQLRTLLGEPVRVDLLIVTHAHQDHVGCLPHLVKHGVITAKWALVADPGLGWGRSADDPPPVDAKVSRVVAALREEVPSEDFEQVLFDAVTLEDSYTEMLAKLTADGTNVVRYGRDSHAALVRAFRSIGLRILGPSEAQLLICADTIARRTRDAVDAVAHLDVQNEVELFRALVESPLDSLDASNRPGPPINLQSVVTRFKVGDVKLLFAGDMQFADPQVGDARLRTELDKLRAAIRAEAPYAFAKLSHHGSPNAFNLDDLGATPVVGICAGEESKDHPHRDVLRVLEAAKDQVQWTRTDRNGLCTITFGARTPITVARGRISDPRPNTLDAPVVEERTVRVTADHQPVEVVTRIPAGVRRVVVTIDVDPGEPARPPPPLELAGGRELPDLVFVTDAQRLAANVGETEARQALDAIRAAGQPVVAPGDLRDALHPGIRGVVIVGGYDVLPAQRRDCLPAAMRASLGVTDDPDDFIVWSDDEYGDDGDRDTPPVPVSRIPDAHSSTLLRAALSAARRGHGRGGVRNSERPFAEDIFAALPGDDSLLVSAPTTFDGIALDADLVYLMLHGDYADGSRFWGEGAAGNIEAVNVRNIPDEGPRVVFTGCCWGALTVDQPAHRTLVAAPKAVNASIALRFLESGATAFVGCTGAHYSPREAPYRYFGGPMHEAFWRGLGEGLAPAEALLAAKASYVLDFPHGMRSEAQHAIEYKTLHQYTCLGLGW